MAGVEPDGLFGAAFTTGNSPGVGPLLAGSAVDEGAISGVTIAGFADRDGAAAP